MLDDTSVSVVFEKSARVRIQVARTSFKGKERLDIRELYESESGEWLPSTKGVAIPWERAAQFAEVLSQVLNAVPEKPSKTPERTTLGLPKNAPPPREAEALPPFRPPVIHLRPKAAAVAGSATVAAPPARPGLPGVPSKPSVQPSRPTPPTAHRVDADDDEDTAQAGCLLQVSYSVPNQPDRKYVLRLVPYALGAQVRDAVSLRTPDGVQFEGRKVGEPFRGALFGGPVGTLCVLRID